MIGDICVHHLYGINLTGLLLIVLMLCRSAGVLLPCCISLLFPFDQLYLVYNGLAFCLLCTNLDSDCCIC